MLVNPQVNRSLAKIEVKVTPFGNVTEVGRILWVVVPSPSCAKSLLPQQYAPPETAIPHEWIVPALTDLNALAPETKIGVRRESCVPSPNWPELLSPQHHAVLLVEIAQLWDWPVDTDAHR